MKALFSVKNATWLKAVLAIAVVVILGSDLSLAHAWVAPTATPPNGNIGLKKYVSDCNSYATNGWADKNECLQDGRWHKVQSNGVWGAVPNGDLSTAVSSGADVKVGYSGSAYYPAAGMYITVPVGQVRCTSAAMTSDGYLNCLSPSGYSGNTDSATLMSGSAANKNIGAGYIKSNGIVTCVAITPSSYYGESITGINAAGCGPYVQAALDWYVKY